MSTLVVAALSARLLAECAARDGFHVIALDVFGDADTRAASASRWFDIGAGDARAQIDGDKVLAALRAIARHGDVLGWVAGSGFEAQPDALAHGAALLPLLGTAPDAAARLRDPHAFFTTLDELGIDHPAVAFTRTTDNGGWLRKDMRGSGGWHIVRGGADAASGLQPGEVLQREVQGVSMSATFVANGSRSLVFGINQQIVRAFGARPHVWRGVVGPVPVDAVLRERLQALTDALTRAFTLRGLASLDFLLHDDGRIDVLEINARPPASMALYAAWRPMAVHVGACRRGELPSTPSSGNDDGQPVHGHEVVFARKPLLITAAMAEALARRAHDPPRAGQRLAAGDPVCSVSAQGPDAAAVHTRLRQHRETVLTSLETTT